MSFEAIRKNKVFAKIYGFTVFMLLYKAIIAQLFVLEFVSVISSKFPNPLNVPSTKFKIF